MITTNVGLSLRRKTFEYPVEAVLKISIKECLFLNRCSFDPIDDLYVWNI